MPNNHNASEFIAGPADHYLVAYDKTKALRAALYDGSQFPDDITALGLEYLGDTQAPSEFTAGITTRERVTQQHGTVAIALQTRTGTLTTSYSQATMELLAKVLHADLTTPSAGVKLLKPSKEIKYFTLVSESPGVEDETDGRLTRRILCAKVAVTSEVTYNSDTDADTLVPVTWTLFAPDNTEGNEMWEIIEVSTEDPTP